MVLKKLSIIFFLILTLNLFSEKYVIVNSQGFIKGIVYSKLNEINVDENIPKGYLLNLEEIDPELDYLVLGCVRKMDLIEKFSEELGKYLREKGYDFVIFGNLRLLKFGEKEYMKYISSSPYIVAEVIFRMLRGFETSGILPIIFLDRNYDRNVYESLKQRAGYFLTLSFFKSNSEIIWLKNQFVYDGDVELKLPWKEYNRQKNLDKIIFEIFYNSIVETGFDTNKKELLYRKIPKKQGKYVVYFSMKVKDFALKILNGEVTATGFKSWSW